MLRNGLANAVDWSGALTHAAVAGGIALALALGLHFGVFAALGRAARMSETPSDDELVARLRQPLRWCGVAVALGLAQEGDPLLAWGWAEVGRFVVPALLGWSAFALLKALAVILENRTHLSTDEDVVRSRRTRIAILSRSAGFLILFVTVALVLFGIPGVRNVGVTLMASAGLVTLAVGAAAQPALKSLIAGLQIAVSEPIRIGDYVVVEGESGRVEDIRLSYVVIRTGDERRVIVPTGKFLDGSFQNWTRVGGGITGSVVLPVKPGCDIAPLREAYGRLLSERPEWDRRTCEVQVAEIVPGAVELKLVMSATDPGKLGRLRPAMREAMLAWLGENAPEALCVEAG